MSLKSIDMKHSKNYMDSKWVVQNPEKYNIGDVERANSFILAYEEGYNQALNLTDIVSRLESPKKWDCSTGDSGPFASEIDWEESLDGEWINKEDVKELINELQSYKIN